MLQFLAHIFVELMRQLAALQQISLHHKNDPTPFNAEGVGLINEVLNDISKACKQMNLHFSAAYVDRLLQTQEHKSEDLSHKTQELFDRIQDELATELFMHITKEKAKYYTEPKKQFGLSTLQKFPSVIRDVEESGKCLSATRNTACVFHLMRIMEVGLRALAKTLNDQDLDPKRNPTWDRILGKCDKELQKPLKDRASEWKSDDQFFSQATAHLRAVKDAWRNPTMHVELHYDADEALDIFNAVRAFMRHLATKLSEPSP